MTRKEEMIEDLTTDEFNQLVDNFIAREDDRIEPSTFLMAMAELEQKRAVNEVELTGVVVNDQIIFDEPAALPVSANTIYVGDLKMILKLRTPDLGGAEELMRAA
jgi:predicted nucleotidyltransferase